MRGDSGTVRHLAVPARDARLVPRHGIRLAPTSRDVTIRFHSLVTAGLFRHTPNAKSCCPHPLSPTLLPIFSPSLPHVNPTQSAHNTGSILVQYQSMPVILGQYFWSWSNSGPRMVGQCFDLCWPAGLLPVFLILVQPWPKVCGQCIELCCRPVFCQYFWSWANRRQKLPANVLIYAGRPVPCQYSRSWCNRAQRLVDNVSIHVDRPVFFPLFLILVQPWPKTGRPI